MSSPTTVSWLTREFMTKDISFWYTRKVKGKMDDLVNRISFALNEEGFSLLTKIDLQEKIKDRLWKDIGKYVILWACNPTLAYEALPHNINIGLFLPCSIVIYKDNWDKYVSIIKPSSFWKIIESDEIERITELADQKLKRVIDNI